MRIDVDRIKKDAIGRWYGILEQLGIEVPGDPNTHSACPICGPGNNAHRFRFDDKDKMGTWICNQCGSGDGWSLLQRVKGLTFMEAVGSVAAIVGGIDFTEGQNEPRKDPTPRLRELYKNSVPLNGKDLASKYLRSRGLVVECQNLRYCDQCYDPETKTNWHAMVATIQNANGDFIGMHRTYLDGTAKRPKMKNPKKLMPAKEPLSGSSVRLFSATDQVGVAEGIETAIAARQIFDIPVWACISSTIMEGFNPPENIRKITVFGDNDASFAGQKAAYRLASRLVGKPFDRIIDVQIPDMPGDDWNDVLMRQIKKG